MVRPSVAWFSPMQPVESGISLYSEELLPLLAGVVDIDVVVDNYIPTQLRESDRLRVVQHRAFRADQYDLIVYQIGNSPAHIYMLPEIIRNSGLLVLHDTVLNHLFIQKAARNGTLVAYRDEMGRRYGADGRRAADRVLKGQAPDDLFRFPMSEQLVDSSRATIVHSEFARQKVLQRSPAAEAFRVPHGLRMPEVVDQAAARSVLGLPKDQFIIASITHINPYKRIDVVLRAFRQLRRTVPARLLLAGSVSPDYPLRRMVAHLGLDQVVDVLGYVEDQQARLIAAAADVIVNLRYPTAGETSGSLLHGMAAARPVLVSQTGSFTEVPGDAVVPVPVDVIEEHTVLAYLTRLARDPGLRGQIGRRARQFIEREHSLQRWADGYVDAIKAATSQAISSPEISIPDEPVIAYCRPHPEPQGTELLNEVAGAMAELGLGGDDTLTREIARSTVELGLGIGKMKQELSTGQKQAGEHE